MAAIPILLVLISLYLWSAGAEVNKFHSETAAGPSSARANVVGQQSGTTPRVVVINKESLNLDAPKVVLESRAKSAVGNQAGRDKSKWWEDDPVVDGMIKWDDVGNRPPPNDPSPAALRTFTIGSHKNEVLRLQGTPSAISNYPALGYEVWTYGFSSVEISTKTDTVTEWTNSSNLKV